MGEWKMKKMSTPALFEQARKVHLMASQSGIDQILLTDFVGERLADKQRIVTLLKRREGYFGSIETSVVKGMLRLLPRLKAHTSATLAPVVCSGLLLGSKGPLAPWAFDNTDRNRTGHNEMNTAIF
ncbi:uncharacterized protein LOC132312767 isoform X2 [Cornus florida]|uniref:uncharacterized protein LOC132312767 isoform X2 n=1 Tax=Cornus florida TaxID=4283 RepID=UPI002897D43B|nr:uncharacterized protein LOC132312767 isoform X2 [Cornus florida]